MMNNFLKPFFLLLSLVLIAMPLVAEEIKEVKVVAVTDSISEFKGICKATQEEKQNKITLIGVACQNPQLSQGQIFLSAGTLECISAMNGLRSQQPATQVSLFPDSSKDTQKVIPTLIVLPKTMSPSPPPEFNHKCDSPYYGRDSTVVTEVAWEAYYATKILLRAITDTQTISDPYELGKWLATKVQIVQVPQSPLSTPKDKASFEPSKVAEQPFEILNKGDILIQLEGVNSHWVEVQRFPEGKTGWIHRGLLKKLPKEESNKEESNKKESK